MKLRKKCTPYSSRICIMDDRILPSSKDCLIRLSNNKMTPTRKRSKKIIHQLETHPNREGLKADLQRDQAFNTFVEKSMEMIYSMRNMEYVEICDITSRVQCHNSLKYWTTSIVCCTFGTCLRPSDKNRKLNKDRFDVLSIPNYVIKNGPSHGARHGNTERQRIY